MNKIARLCLLAWFFGIVSHPSIATDSFDDKRPNEHICPITLHVMKDPVVAADGHFYERNAILQHFKSYATSPITGLPLKNKDLFDNHALKTMIAEWKPGKQAEPSVLDTRDAGSIAQRVRKEFSKNAALLNSAKDQHIVAFLGNTGAGKSTLVNLLAGKEIKKSLDDEDYVLADPSDKAAMVIGTGGHSETLYPKSIDVEGLRFFDLPGFNDTDGSERNIVNAAFMRQILLDAASVRLVLVVGQDQFTADRSASVKQMLHSIKRLFVADQDTSLVDEGVFVATKVTCNEKTEMTDFLLKKTDSKDKAELYEQLKSWTERNKLCRMFHPIRDASNIGIRDHILRIIKETRPAKIHGINVSILYPSATKGSLERIFFKVFEEKFGRMLNVSLTTLSDFDKAITFYTSQDFWETFDADVCREDGTISLLKEFCVNSYYKAIKDFKKDNERKHQTHIQDLRNQRQTRIENIERRTDQRAKEVISSIVPRQENDDFVAFDFAYHKDYYDQVCSPASIAELATDALEQEVVRRYYAGFISQHSHEQMMRWHQKFSGAEELTRRIVTMEERLKTLESGRAEEEKPLAKEEKRPAKMRLIIPPVAREYDDIYQQFLKGVLIYRPNKGNDEGRIDMPIAALDNPLEGKFDLSQCGDAGQYLSISTGYRKGKIVENTSKVEIWLAPRFLIEQELKTTANHFQEIFGTWSESAPVGIFWTWGGWEDLTWYDYLTTENYEELSNNNLYEKQRRALPTNVLQRIAPHSIFQSIRQYKSGESRRGRFQVHFLNCVPQTNKQEDL